MSNAIKDIKKYFQLQELVSKAVYDKYGEYAWNFFDEKLLATIVALREIILCVPLVCNNWKSGGSFSQRGFRENTCEIVAEKTRANKIYCSAHCLGKGIDLSSPKMTADEMRKKIEANKSILPYSVRIEDAKSAPTWLHIDIMCEQGGINKVTYFSA